MKKIQQEKKVAERQNKALASQPNKREKEEIDNLKKQLQKLTEDLTKKEQNYKLNMDK